MKAIDAYNTAVSINQIKHEDELEQIMAHIEEQSNNGKFNYVWSHNMMDTTKAVLIKDGFEVQQGGRMNETNYSISWKNVNNPDAVGDILELNFDEKGASLNDNIREGEVSFIDKLCDEFKGTVGFRKDLPKVWVSGFINRPYDVVVFEKGIRGPADWFYLNDNHKWAHGGYTGYKQTYDNVDFINFVRKTHEHNEKYGN